MSRGGGFTIAIAGIILALISLKVSFDSGEKATQEHLTLHKEVKDTKKVISDIANILGRFRLNLSETKAHAAEAPSHLDYSDYLNTLQAKSDLHDIDKYVESNNNDIKSMRAGGLIVAHQTAFF